MVWTCRSFFINDILSNVFLNIKFSGAAYGTAKAGIGIAGVGQFRPDL
jgi:hypothetical protein